MPPPLFDPGLSVRVCRPDCTLCVSVRVFHRTSSRVFKHLCLERHCIGYQRLWQQMQCPTPPLSLCSPLPTHPQMGSLQAEYGRLKEARAHMQTLAAEVAHLQKEVDRVSAGNMVQGGWGGWLGGAECKSVGQSKEEQEYPRKCGLHGQWHRNGCTNS